MMYWQTMLKWTSGTNLQVDVDGAAGPAGFVTVATLSAATTTINILFTDKDGNDTSGTI